MRFGSRRRRDEPFPAEWRSIIEERFLPWRYLDGEAQARLLDLTRELIERKMWEAAQGFELTDEMRVTIAVHAALLILELDHRYYRGVQAIIVHPTTVVLTGERPAFTPGLQTDDPLPVIGRAQPFGPVVIVWDAASNQARHPERGHNVVYHEFAHKLDMLDGGADGMPPMASAAEAARWREVVTREYQLLAEGEGGDLLAAYAAVNPGEFFAVATEVFFDRPVELRRDKPDLYDVLRSFYRQDPAGRAGQAPP
jgi:MtfA peptidase